jgi:hypothetical protein
MTLFEVLYGCRYHTPLNWIESGEKVIFGPDHVEEAEVISKITRNPRSHARRLMQTRGIDHWSLK